MSSNKTLQGALTQIYHDAKNLRGQSVIDLEDAMCLAVWAHKLGVIDLNFMTRHGMFGKSKEILASDYKNRTYKEEIENQSQATAILGYIQQRVQAVSYAFSTPKHLKETRIYKEGTYNRVLERAIMVHGLDVNFRHEP